MKAKRVFEFSPAICKTINVCLGGGGEVYGNLVSVTANGTSYEIKAYKYGPIALTDDEIEIKKFPFECGKMYRVVIEELEPETKTK